MKPTVSAGARDTGRFSGAAAAGDLVARLHAQGRTAMVQPYVDAVDEHGETSVLAFGGEVSHGARKAPLLLPGTAVRLDDTDTDTDNDTDTDLDGDDVVQPREPTPAELAVARAALDAVPWHEPLVYARVDLVPGPGGPLVLELEVTEPSLFLRLSEGAAARCATAVQAALAR